ncbi:MAG: GxxExxY protein [Chloroflexi bacterium]|nr:GxxExxY protein [Chloroflexota bacterium]
MLEAVYQKALSHELKLRGIIYYEQVRLIADAGIIRNRAG